MKKDFWFFVSLVFSVLFVCWCFVYANSVRVSNVIGGEIFTITIPLYIVANKLDEMDKKIKRLKRQNMALNKNAL